MEGNQIMKQAVFESINKIRKEEKKRPHVDNIMKHAASLTGLPEDEIKDCIAFMVKSGYLDRNLTTKGEETYFICNNKVAAEEEMDSCDTTLGLGFGSFATPTSTSHHQTPQLKSPEANKTDFMVFLDVVAKLTDDIRSTNSSS
eukprot:gene19754-21689_t